MRRLNKQFRQHDRTTDVLSFRYDGRAVEPHPPIVGEILIAPSEARAYAKRHGLSYQQELSRYVIHGLLHWKGYDDKTPAQRCRMRALEDSLLARYCRNGASCR
jgi:probable rRNA maturation factor